MAVVDKSIVTRALPPDAQELDEPIIAPKLPLLTRIRCSISVWAFQTFVIVGLGALRLVQPAKFRAIAPTYSKTYDIRPSLPCRVFVPKNHKAGTNLPLHIDIHGGGFALCDPQTDDHFCHAFANTHGYCVVSINYRKAPGYPYPIPVEDCAALAKAVLDDQDLPVDFNKVSMGGFSAGANLVLAIAQLDGVKERVKAIVPVYPVCDFSSRYRGEYRKNKQGKDDILKRMTRLFNWAYVPYGTNRRLKTLSPVYASRQDLPQACYIIGAEYDVLCNEANVTAKNLAGLGEADTGPAWEQNNVRWEMLPDVQHGFTHIELKGAEEEARQKLCAEMYARIDVWIRRQWS